jgi:hypothetical protein
MNDHAFTLAGAGLRALPSGALHWPDMALLCVSDLHFGRSERLARRGGTLLPPYETRATLARLDADLERSGARRVVCLGDSFDDAEAAGVMGDDERLWLSRMMAGREWTWIAGNHDPAPLALGGGHRAVLRLGPLLFRHIAEPQAQGEVSGHYHPKASLAGQSRPCFLIDAGRVVLPAYGTFTGGLGCTDPALAALMQEGAIAVLTGRRALAFPMPRHVRGSARPFGLFR